MKQSFLDIIYSRKLRAKWLSKKLIELLPSGSIILNVGAGRGYLEKEFSESNFQITSLEPGKTELQKNIIRSSFETANINQKFDAIIFSYSLHHLDDPSVGITKALSLLNKNGTLWILEIAPKTKLWKVLAFDSRIACPWRKHTWTKSGLEKLVQDAGGKITKTIQYRQIAPLFIIKKA